MAGEESISVSELSVGKQLAFGLLAFERMLPSLLIFSRDTGFNDSYCLNAREAAWSALRSDSSNILDPSLKEACLENAPDTEEFSHPLTSNALNAVLAISDIVEFALDGTPDRIANISTLATDSVYLYLTSLESSVVLSPAQERKIKSHLLMQQELDQEAEDIKFLATLPDHFDDKMISTLRARANSQHSVLVPDG